MLKQGTGSLNLLALLAFASACSGYADSRPEDEPLGTAQDAADAANDRRVAAAVEVRANGRRDVWVFACDTDRKLRRLIHVEAGEWTEEGIIDHDCRGVPSIAKYSGPNSDAIAVYSRYGDGQLWEASFPDTSNWQDFTWSNVSAESGFGDMNGSPVVVDSGAGGEVSVALTKASDSSLYTLDWSGSWSYRRVLRQGGSDTAISTINRVVGKRLPSGGRYMAGRGLGVDDSSTGWVARRTGGWTDPYVLHRTLDAAGGVKGTPAIANDRVYVWSADQWVPLKGRRIGASSDSGWLSLRCYVEEVFVGRLLGGSPVTNPDFEPGLVRTGYVRTPSGQLMSFLEIGEPNAGPGTIYSRGCGRPVGIKTTSTPEWILGAQVSGGPHANSLVVRDEAGELRYYNATTGKFLHLNVAVATGG